MRAAAASAAPAEEGATGSAAAAAEPAPVDKRLLRKQQAAETKRKQKQEKETYRSIMSVSTKAAPAARASRASVASAASAKTAASKAAATKATAPAASAVASVASSSRDRRRSAAAEPPAAAATVPATAAATVAGAAENDEECVAFPPLCADKLRPALFEEDGFPMFLSLASPGVDAALISAAPPQPHTRAPSSQVLHAVRSQIYRELAEEYFGRFMKDTPDAEQVAHQAEAADAGAAAASAHSSAAASSAAAPAAAAAAAPAKHPRRAKAAAAPSSKGKGVDARSPEQLRMIFCELFNRCEAERVPSTAGYNERADLCFVTPLDAAHQLTSFSATDVASMMRGPAPPTLEQFQAQQRREAAQPRPRPLPINPHFDLFQYRPIVANDEYERIDDEVARALLDKDAHPTLAPSPPLAGGTMSPPPTVAGAGAGATAAATPGAATAMDIDTQAIGGSTPLIPHALQSPVISVSAAAAPLKTEGGSGDYSAAATAATASMQIDQVSETATPPASVKAEEADSMAAVGATLSGSPMSPSALSSMTHGATPSPPLGTGEGEVVAAIDVAPSTASAVAAAAAAAVGVDINIGAASSSSSPSPAPVTAPVVASLPPLAHGVGMLGALDFNSSHMHSYREHWANSCFSWRFGNYNRTFSAHAYSSTNADTNDSALVSSILSGAQAAFHAQLQQDEAEEEALIASHAKRSRAARAHNNKYADEGKETSSAAAAAPSSAAAAASSSATPAQGESTVHPLPHFDATGLPVIGAYSQGSAEYESLKRRIRVSWEESLSQSLFLPHTFLRDVSPSLHKRAERMAAECVAHLAARVQLPHDEVPIDDLFKLVVPGFGCGGVQVFLKIGLCVTLLHDEIGWSGCHGKLKRRASQIGAAPAR